MPPSSGVHSTCPICYNLDMPLCNTACKILLTKISTRCVNLRYNNEWTDEDFTFNSCLHTLISIKHSSPIEKTLPAKHLFENGTLFINKEHYCMFTQYLTPVPIVQTTSFHTTARGSFPTARFHPVRKNVNSIYIVLN